VYKYFLLGLFVLVGCGAAKNYEASEEEYKQSNEEYNIEAKKCSIGVSTYVEIVKCVNKNITDHFARVGYENMDLIELYTAYYLAVASRIDKGTMTPEEGDLIMVQVKQEVINKETERMVSEPDGWTKFLQAFTVASSTYFQNRAYNRPITCTQNGPFINCY